MLYHDFHVITGAKRHEETHICKTLTTGVYSLTLNRFQIGHFTTDSMSLGPMMVHLDFIPDLMGNKPLSASHRVNKVKSVFALFVQSKLKMTKSENNR